MLSAITTTHTRGHALTQTRGKNGKFVIELAFLFVQTGIWLAELSVSVSCVVLGRFDLALRANLLARLLY